MITPGKTIFPGQSLNETLENLKPAWVILFMLLLHLAMHGNAFRLPAVGNHVWRQCNTLALATNFAEEDMNILHPRIDKRLGTSGITGPEFPAYSWTLALFYKVFGIEETLHRWFSWLIFAAALIGMYRLTMALFKRRTVAYFSLFFLCFVPELFYHSVNAVPDLLAMSAMIWGAFFFFQYIHSGSKISLTGMTFCLVLAGAVKLQFLLIGFPLAWFFIRQFKNMEPAKKWYLVFSASVIVFSALAWYRYAHYLTQLNGLHEFTHLIRWPKNTVDFIKTLNQNILQDIPEIWVGYPFLLPFVIGVVSGVRHLKKNIWVLCWLLGFGIFYLAEQSQFNEHGYYTISLMPLLAMTIAKGFETIFRNRFGALAIILLITAPVWAYLRVTDSNWGNNKNIPTEFLSSENRTRFRELSANNKRWIVGPDQSGCVYFYYLHAKGFPWYNESEDVGIIEKFIAQGAQGVITDRPVKFEKMVIKSHPGSKNR